VESGESPRRGTPGQRPQAKIRNRRVRLITASSRPASKSRKPGAGQQPVRVYDGVKPFEEPALSNETGTEIELEGVTDEVLGELTRRVEDIDNSYRAVAEKMGQLYMCADANKVATLTRSLDKPMRNASDNEQMFAAILDTLKMHAKQR